MVKKITFHGILFHLFCKPPRPELLWGPPSLLSSGYQGLFSRGLSARDVKLTTHLHLVPRSKNEWSYTSTPPIHLYGVVLFKAQGQLYLYLYYFTCFTILKYFNMSVVCCSCTQIINYFVTRWVSLLWVSPWANCLYLFKEKLVNDLSYVCAITKKTQICLLRSYHTSNVCYHL
jgi:hypothetical protein